MSKQDFADRFYALLFEHDIHPETLAEKLGVVPLTVINYCRGKIYPNGENLIKLAEIFGVSIDYLLMGKQPVKTSGLSSLQNVMKLKDYHRRMKEQSR